MFLQAEANEMKERSFQLYSIGNSLPGLMTYQVVREEDGTMRFMFVSESVTQITGKSPQQVLDDPSTFYNSIVEEDRLKISEAERRSMQNLSLFVVEVKSRTANGEIRWLHIRSMPRKLEDGRIMWEGVCSDITQRKETELRLAESEKNLRNVLASMADAFYAIDKNYIVIIINENARQAIQKTWGKSINVGTNLMEILPAHEAERIKKNFKKVFRGEKLEYEVHQTMQGVPKWVLVSILPVNDEKAGVVGAHVTVKDISEQKVAEERIRHSEERYRLLIEQASDAIMITDIDGNFVNVNTSFCEMLGYPKDELKGLNIRNLIDPVQLQKQPMHFEELKKGKHVFTHRRMLHKNGSIIDVESNVKLMPDGSVLAIARDITERKKVEDAVKTSEETKRLIMNAALDAIIVMSKEGKVTSWNPQAAKIFGWKEKEATGKFLTELIIPKHLDDRHKKGLELYLQTGNAKVLNKMVEMPAIDKNGREFPVEMSIVPIRQGAELFFCGFLRDISERKKAEQQLLESKNRISTILNTEPECIKLLGRDGELLDMNPAGLAMIEVDDLEKIRGQKIETIVNLAYRQAFHNLTQNVFKGRSGKLEFEITGLKGTKRWLSSHAVPLKDSTGKIISLLSVTRDITDMKRAEEELIREKNLSDSIINSLPGIFYLYDKNGKFLRWNKNFEAISGYTASELATMHPMNFFEGEDKILLQKKVREVFENGRGEVEAYTVMKNKKKIPFYFNGWRVVFDGNPCLIGVGIDITERKKAEQEMMIANERFNLIARATNDFVWDAYLDTNKVWWNDNYYLQLGWTKGVEIPGGDSWESHIHEKDKKRVVERLSHILNHTDESTWTDEYRFVKANGTFITVYDRGYIMRDKNGKAYRMIGAMTDISKMKQAENLLKRSFDDIRRLALHLEKVREEERIAIAREIHDELGQQLTVLKMDISWLNKNLTLAEEKQMLRMKDMMQTVDNTIKTIRRISSELRPSILDDLGLMAALEWLLADFEKRSGITTRLVSDFNELNLDMNIKTALFRVFQESLTNVARHAQATEVNVVLKKVDDQLLIVIKDNGNGFVVNSIANKKTLGILGIKERIAIINGTYKIDSTLGEGTQIEIRVPFSSQTET